MTRKHETTVSKARQRKSGMAISGSIPSVARDRRPARRLPPREGNLRRSSGSKAKKRNAEKLSNFSVLDLRRRFTTRKGYQRRRLRLKPRSQRRADTHCLSTRSADQSRTDISERFRNSVGSTGRQHDLCRGKVGLFYHASANDWRHLDRVGERFHRPQDR